MSSQKNVLSMTFPSSSRNTDRRRRKLAALHKAASLTNLKTLNYRGS